MGFWFNNFLEFERKKSLCGKRLVLNFYYSPDDEEIKQGKKPRSVKILMNKDVRIPSGFIFAKAKVDKSVNELEELGIEKHRITINRKKKFFVLSVLMPYVKEKIDELPSAFQTGSYEKLVKLEGYFPDRKAKFFGELEKKLVNEKEEIEILNDNYIRYDSFMSAEEIKSLPTLYIDVEKPLWKKDEEKELIKERKKLIKEEAKYQKIPESEIAYFEKRDHEDRIKELSEIEQKLTIEVGGVGKVNLWEELVDAKVSFMTLCWSNIAVNGERKTIREMLVLDPNNEIESKEVNGYQLYKFKTEKELLEYFLEKIKERKPVICSGHNVVYDSTQTRFAVENTKAGKGILDWIVNKIQPRRDFVKHFYQRHKQDMLYLDTMWLTRNFAPWLMQRSLGASLKLEDVANYWKFDFKKTAKHEELRIFEFQRLFGKTPEIRRMAREALLKYSASDVEPVKFIIENSPFIDFLVLMKEIMPYCTYTELAFAPNCIEKYLDKKHFEKAGNLANYRYKQKIRENELQIFKKRFPKLKKAMLEHVCIDVKTKPGNYENVYEIYLPFEEWLKERLFLPYPEFKNCYKKTEGTNTHLAFLQYMKRLSRDMLKDYYFARRERKVFDECMERGINAERFYEFESFPNKKLFDSYYASLNHLKDQFRSIYVDLKGEERRLLVDTNENMQAIEGEMPLVMSEDFDLFLLRKNASLIEGKIKEHHKRTLKGFLSNFKKWEETQKLIIEEIEKAKKMQFDDEERAKYTEHLYAYNQMQRKKQKEKVFYAKYGFDVEALTNTIVSSYEKLANELREIEIIDMKGDYLFVKAGSEENARKIKESQLWHVVRKLDNYSTE